MLRILRLFFYLFILVLGLGFAVRNAQIVTLDYYFGTWQITLSLALVMVMALGALLGIITCLGVIMRLKSNISMLRRSVKSAETESMTMRVIPLKDIGSA